MAQLLQQFVVPWINSMNLSLQLVSALKAVPYFDVNVVDYKAKWVILSAWLNLTNDYLSLFRVYPFLKQIEVSYSYPQLYSLPSILLSYTFAHYKYPHSLPTHHTLHTPHTDEPQLRHFHGHAWCGTDSHALPTRLGWSIWNVSSHYYFKHPFTYLACRLHFNSSLHVCNYL